MAASRTLHSLSNPILLPPINSRSIFVSTWSQSVTRENVCFFLLVLCWSLSSAPSVITVSCPSTSVAGVVSFVTWSHDRVWRCVLLSAMYISSVAFLPHLTPVLASKCRKFMPQGCCSRGTETRLRCDGLPGSVNPLVFFMKDRRHRALCSHPVETIHFVALSWNGERNSRPESAVGAREPRIKIVSGVVDATLLSSLAPQHHDV